MSQIKYVRAVVADGECCVYEGKRVFKPCRHVKMLDETTGIIEEVSHICEDEELIFIIGKGWKSPKEYSLDIKPRDLGDILPRHVRW